MCAAQIEAIMSSNAKDERFNADPYECKNVYTLRRSPSVCCSGADGRVACIFIRKALESDSGSPPVHMRTRACHWLLPALTRHKYASRRAQLCVRQSLSAWYSPLPAIIYSPLPVPAPARCGGVGNIPRSLLLSVCRRLPPRARAHAPTLRAP